MVHVIKSDHVYAQSTGYWGHVQAKGFQEFDEVQLLTCEWIVQSWTSPIALWPRTLIHQPVVAEIFMKSPSMSNT